MVKRIGGSRRKSRHKFSKPHRRKGKMGLSKYFQSLKEGDKVILKAEPSVQKGLYDVHFHGSSGVVKDKRKSCYEVAVKDKKKEKILIIHPVHLQKV